MDFLKHILGDDNITIEETVDGLKVIYKIETEGLDDTFVAVKLIKNNDDQFIDENGKVLESCYEIWESLFMECAKKYQLARTQLLRK